MAKISSEFIAIGCNRTTGAAAWGTNGLVAFGADKFVALYDPLVNSFIYIYSFLFFFCIPSTLLTLIFILG